MAHLKLYWYADMEIDEEDEKKFINMVKKKSEVSVWSTIVGIGMDLARNTVEETSKTPGCNYATVISSKDFREMMEHEFDYTVVSYHVSISTPVLRRPQTPIGFNVSLSVDSEVWQLHSGYGSPEVSSLKIGGTARQSTLFPSTQDGKGETRGGIFLFKLDQKQLGSLEAPFTVVYVTSMLS